MTTDYLIAPIPGNEQERLAALRAGMCAYVPREERFDRITRMAQRMMHVPIALITMITEDEQWFRSAQGLPLAATERSISFCGHAIMTGDVFQVRDTHLDIRFAFNPLVVGPPYMRSYCGWPLELAPGLRAGTLCVIDTMPRTFEPEDLETLSDLARMAETELRIDAMANNQKALLTESSRSQRKQWLDPSTGCWSPRGFEELLRRTLIDVGAGTVHAALCGIRVLNKDDFNVGDDEGAHEVRAMLIAQFIRQRLPANAVLCRLPGGYACAMFAARSSSLLREQVSTFLQEPGSQPIPGIQFSRKLEIVSMGLRLKVTDSPEQAKHLFDDVMGKLSGGEGAASVLR